MRNVPVITLLLLASFASAQPAPPPTGAAPAEPTFLIGRQPPGPLGYNMGVQLLIEAVVVEPGASPWISVVGLNNQALSSATLRAATLAPGYSGPPIAAKGAAVKFMGYETAGMTGAPDWARAESAALPVGPWRFGYRVVAVGPEGGRVLPAAPAKNIPRATDDYPIGQFGLPVGTRIEAEGMAGGGGNGTRALIVDRINGKPLPAQKIVNVPTAQSPSRAAPGTRFRIMGYESWGQANAPSWARDSASRSGGPMFGFSFVTLKAETADGKPIAF